MGVGNNSKRPKSNNLRQAHNLKNKGFTKRGIKYIICITH